MSELEAEHAMIEKAARFGEFRSLAGIVTEPGPGAVPSVGFVFLNAGVVHRVGPNRIHVTAARRLAAQGFLSVRFDLSGLGDSDARRDALLFEQAAVLEVREVLTAIERDYGVRRFVLAGLCSGAVVSFRAALADERVAGAVLLNPQGFVESPEWRAHVVQQARAREYWTRKVFRAESWRRALTGRSDYRTLLDVVSRRVWGAFRKSGTVSQVADELAGKFRQLHARGVRVLLVCSEGDLGVDYLNLILGERFTRADGPHSRTVILPPGDHSLTLFETQERFFDALTAWAAAWAPAAAHEAGARAGAAFEAALSRAHAPLRS